VHRELPSSRFVYRRLPESSRPPPSLSVSLSLSLSLSLKGPQKHLKGILYSAGYGARLGASARLIDCTHLPGMKRALLSRNSSYSPGADVTFRPCYIDILTLAWLSRTHGRMDPGCCAGSFTASKRCIERDERVSRSGDPRLKDRKRPYSDRKYV